MNNVPEDIKKAARKVYDEIFRVGEFLYAPVPFDPYAIIERALLAERERATAGGKFKLGDRVTKTKGSSWTGLVVGFYSTKLTPIGYAVESENEPGSVQIYPEAAIRSPAHD